ncbi:plasmid replication protein [Enterococcus faecalis]|nr:plasmid replication protein [Enterococcus faecalis]
MIQNPLEQIKSRTIMYTNQVDRLESLGLPTTCDELLVYFQTLFTPVESIAIILHDKDISPDGSTAEPHFHIAMKFENPRSLMALSNKLSDRPQNFTVFNKKGRNNYNNMMSYLTHRTTESQAKYQYSPHDVKANFNYPEWLELIGGSITIARKVEINTLLEEFGHEKISLKQLRALLTPLEYAKNSSIIKHIQALIAENRYEQFKEEMIQQHKQIETFYLYGTTGTGKTRFAKEKFSSDCFITGSNRDMFANYDGEKTVILDEIRPDTITYNELLKLLDPFNFNNVVGSRYYDKKLVAERLIITTPYPPHLFYQKIKHPEGVMEIERDGPNRVLDATFNDPDKAEQLFRRINVLEFEKEYITPMYFNPDTLKFEPLSNQKFVNKWSQEGSTFKSKEDFTQSINALFGDDKNVV